MATRDEIINQTKKWINDVVVGCNFCPFAAREVKNNTIHYEVENSPELAICLEALLNECFRLDKDPAIETSFLIFPTAFADFHNFLDVISLAEKLLKRQGYEGIYQVASFHPQYCFAGSSSTDAANYTNRSAYPMLQLLREESVEQALLRYPNPEQIPARNIDFSRKKGEAYMKALRESCFE